MEEEACVLAYPVRSSSSSRPRPTWPRSTSAGSRRDQRRPARRRAAGARRLGAHPRRLRPVQDRRGGGGRGPGTSWRGSGRPTPTSCGPAAASRVPVEVERERVRRRRRCVSSTSTATPTRPRRWPRRSPALCEPGRQYKFMEVCGGHTHTIYKHGLEDYLPGGDHPGARPGLPGLRDPDGPGRRRDRHRRAAGRDLDLVRRHDAGARRRRLVLRRERRRRRHPHGLLAAGRAEDRPAEPGQAGRVHGHRVRDDRAVHRDDGAAGGRRRGSTTSPSSATTSRSCRRSRPSSTRRTCASTASSAPGTCPR